MIEGASILSTGDEITSGFTVDTNSNWLADRLFVNGIDLVSVITVGDRPERIRWAFEQAIGQADLVLSTGGLGPTADDLTTPTLAEALGRTVVRDQVVADHIRQMFRSVSREMPENNLRQADFPEGAVIIPNPRGTAAGFRIDVERGGGTCHVIAMPGVPREMKPMFDDSVLPWIRSLDQSREVFQTRVFQTFGVSESALDEMVAGAIDESEARVSFRAAFPQISVRLTVRGAPGEIAAKVAPLAARVRERLAGYVFGEGPVTMEETALAAVRERGWTVSLAESCTGGLVGERLTSVPGSSEAFLGSLVAYSEEVKKALLGVAPETLDRFGSVSEEAAREMAEGARRATSSDVGVSVTGIAGPGGGDEKNPVGTVVLGLAADRTLIARRYKLWGNREWIRLLASQIALDWIRRHALGQSVAEPLFMRK